MCDVLAVVVTHNRLELLKKCVAALEAQPERCDILLVDNASDDQTPQWAEQARSANDRISYVRLEQNTGGAGGFHFGMKWAVERGYRFAWLMTALSAGIRCRGCWKPAACSEDPSSTDFCRASCSGRMAAIA